MHELQITLDDLWSLDVVKLSGWQLVQDNSAGKEDFQEDTQQPSDSDGSEEDDFKPLIYVCPTKMLGCDVQAYLQIQ